MSVLPILGSKLALPLAFTTQLPFSNEDLVKYPFLRNNPRYYCISGVLGEGGKAIAYLGYVSDGEGNRIGDYKELVIKVPNLNPDLFIVDDMRTRLVRIAEDSGREWKHTRARLRTSIYANPIIDQQIFQIYYRDYPLLIAVTVQFRQEIDPLDEFLVKIHQRPEKVSAGAGGGVDKWHGMNNMSKWIGLARSIATAIADTHERRVVHGDIWPPNIFIAMEDEKANRYHTILIDFGESFPLEPEAGDRSQRDNCYRAPERNDGQSIVTQKADVYSYGKLLLYLASGAEPLLPREFKGYDRRRKIKEIILEWNAGLGIIARNPFVLDIICRCVSLDPIDRPSMREVVMALNSYVDIDTVTSLQPRIAGSIDHLQQSWRHLSDRLVAQGASVSPFLEELIEQKINDIQQVVSGLSNETVIINDTREKVILAMISLFQRLQTGDRYISLTSPQLWRSSALGLDGRYFTATILATARGASIQRCFIFSIQELGETWVQSLVKSLREDPVKHELAEIFAKALERHVTKFQAMKQMAEAADLPEELLVDAQKQLTHVIASYVEAEQGLCRSRFDPRKYGSFSECQGLYLGLIPVTTLSEAHTLKSAHPASIFYYGHADEQDRYLLMMTDCHARNDVGTNRSRPELRGIMVFKSATGDPPVDKIQRLEQIFRQSANVGGWIEKLHAAMEAANDRNQRAAPTVLSA